MKEYGMNFLLTALITLLVGILSFLIGNEQAVHTAMAAVALSGLVLPLSYIFGKLMDGAAWNKEMAIRLIIMLVTGVAFGLFGGWSMTLW